MKRGGVDEGTHSVITGNPDKDSLPVIQAPKKTAQPGTKKKPKVHQSGLLCSELCMRVREAGLNHS